MPELRPITDDEFSQLKWKDLVYVLTKEGVCVENAVVLRSPEGSPNVWIQSPNSDRNCLYCHRTEIFIPTEVQTWEDAVIGIKPNN